MITVANTIEDLLELAVGLTGRANINIDSSDQHILSSLARQVCKGTGLTDRQYSLAKEKLVSYKDQFTALEYEFDLALETLRIPLRQLDRSKWIKIVEYPENQAYESYKTHHWIAVRFVFNKKLISVIDAIKSTDRDAIYDKENKIHYFALSEKNIYNIVNALKDKNFDIDPLLQEKYEIIKTMNDNKNDYVPGVYGFKLRNVSAKAIDYIISDVGEPNAENLALYKDRDDLYGLEHFDETDLNASINKLTALSQKIVKRNKNTILVNKDHYNFGRLVESILELDRLPLLIIVNSKNDYDELVYTYKCFENIVEDCAVLYRKDNKEIEDRAFNKYIADNNLNVKLDNNPRIVYINNDKFPKTLLRSSWKPSAALVIGSNSFMTNTKLQSYIGELDLVIHYDSDASPYLRHNIEKI